MRTGALLAIAAAVALGPGCRRETIEKPSPPDMADVLVPFDAPPGTFDDATAARVRRDVDELLSQLVGLGAPQRLVDDVTTALKRATGAGKALDAGPPPADAGADAIFEGEGFGQVTRRCDGWQGASAADADPGQLEATLTFSLAAVDAIVWGTARRCRFDLAGRRLLVDEADGAGVPALRLHLGGALPPREVGTRPITIALRARVELDGAGARGDIAARVLPGGGLEVLVGGPTDAVVVGVTATAATSVRAKNGRFSCDASGCRRDDGGLVPW